MAPVPSALQLLDSVFFWDVTVRMLLLLSGVKLASGLQNGGIIPQCHGVDGKYQGNAVEYIYTVSQKEKRVWCFCWPRASAECHIGWATIMGSSCSCAQLTIEASRGFSVISAV